MTILLVAAVAVCAAALSGVGRPEAARSEAAPGRSTITTLGLGTITTVPDTAVITAGVRTEAVTAADALAANGRRMQRVIDALKAAGGAKLQTRQVSLYPRTDDRGETTGFVAQNSVEARTAIAHAGELVDAAVAAGANTVDGPQLERSDRDALYRDALGKALEDAKLKAAALARAGGFAVGRVVAVVEEGSSQPGPVVFEAQAVAKDASTPIEPGTQDVEARVSVAFAIA